MFVYAPNTQIKEHPIRFGSGNMTCVIGVMTGTFTKPMPIGDGKFIQPTGKSFKLPMCTVGIWMRDVHRKTVHCTTISVLAQHSQEQEEMQ